MKRQLWQVHATTHLVDQIPEDEETDEAEQLAHFARVHDIAYDPTAAAIVATVEAGTIEVALTGLARALHAVPPPWGRLTIDRAALTPHGGTAPDLRNPGWVLLGCEGVAQLLNARHGSGQDIVGQPGFPHPVARTHAGRLWDSVAVNEWREREDKNKAR